MARIPYRIAVIIAILYGIVIPTLGRTAPYASRVSVTGGTDVSFILNEPADFLAYRINGGPLEPLDGSTAGSKSFSLLAATDTFDIIATKTDAVGYSIPTGGVIPSSMTGLSQPSNQSGFRLISDDDNPLTRFNSPRGVGVAADPNSPNFGVAYVSNAAAGTAAGRALGDGIYALNPDQTDAFGFGNIASNPVVQDGFPAFTPSSGNSPFRLHVAESGQLYVADWSDANGNLFQLSPDLMTGVYVFEGFGGMSPLPPGANHGSISSAHVAELPGSGQLTIYTVDEDLTSGHLDGVSSTADSNSLWRYDIASAAPAAGFGGSSHFSAGPFPTQIIPVRVSDVLLPLVNTDMDRGADGKFYLSQNRNAGNEAGVYVVDEAGNTLFDSLSASRTLLADPSAADILRNVLGIAVSSDQKWLAVMLNNSNIAMVPLMDGIPKLENRLLVDTGPDVIAGRDVAFDAAGNLHYVSSGQSLYRVLAPGGATYATTSFDGASFTFHVSTVPEPAAWSSALCACLGLLAFWGRSANRRVR